MVLEELKRIELDIELAQNYPQNMEEILKRKAEYHELYLYDIKPLEEYGIHVEPVR